MSQTIKSYLAATFTAFLFAVSAYAQLYTTYNHNIDIYFSPDNEVYQTDQALQSYFPQDDVFMFLLEGDDLYSKEFLTQLDTATGIIEGLDNVERVINVTNLENVQGTEDGFSVSDLIDVNKDMELTDAQRKSKALSNRFAQGMITNKDGTALGFIVRPTTSSDTMQQMSIRDETITVLKEHGIYPYVTAISGQSETIHAQLAAMFESLQKFLPLAILINIILIIWIYPRPFAVFLACISVGIAMQTPIMALNLFHKDFTMIHAMLPTLMTALCVALLVHYFNRIKHYSQLSYNSEQRAYKARDDIFKAAFFASLTTACGLLSLALSPIPPIQTFGITATIGVITIFIVVMFCLPPILARWDKDTPWKQGYKLDALLGKATMACARFTIRKPAVVLFITIITLLCSIPLIQQIRVETNTFRFFSESHPLNVSTHRVEEKLAGITTLELFIETDEFDALKSPELIKELKSLQNWLETLPEVDQTASYAEMIEDMHWAFNGEDESFRIIPDNRALITQYLFVYDATDLYDFVNYDFDKTHISINLNTHTVGEIDHVISKINDYIDRNPLTDAQLRISGFGTLFKDISRLVVKTQLLSLSAAIVVIFVFMIIVFRSLRSGLLCMIPNVSPIILIFMIMGGLGIWLDIGTAMIASIGVGIAVDDTIHLYHAYIRRKRAGLPVVLSLLRAYQHEGRAVIITTLILATQFLIIGLSDFLPTSNFGILSAVSVTAALIFDLFTLPAVIIVANHFNSKKPKTKT